MEKWGEIYKDKKKTFLSLKSRRLCGSDCLSGKTLASKKKP